MKLIAKGTAAEAMLRRLHKEGYNLFIVEENGRYIAYEIVKKYATRPAPPPIPSPKVTLSPDPLLTPGQKQALYWIVCTILSFIFLKILRK